MMNDVSDICVVIHPMPTSTVLSLIGDVRIVLRASCTWGTASSKGNIAVVKLSDKGIRFGIGVAAFGHPPEQAIQRLGECVLIEGIPWWVPAEKPPKSRQERGESELLSPFLVTCNALDSASAVLDSACGLSLIRWYEQILEHPEVGRTGAVAIEVVAQVPAGRILDRYMCRSPLAHSNTLSEGQMIVDPELMDEYFFRNSIRRTVPSDSLCTLVMVGIVLDPITVARIWGEDLLQRACYTVAGMNSDARVIHHTHAAVMLDSPLLSDQLCTSRPSFEKRIDLVTQGLSSQPHKVSVVHVESDILLNHALARIGIIEDLDVVALT